MKPLYNPELFKSASIFAGIMSLLALAPLSLNSFRQVMLFSVWGVSLWIAWASYHNRQYLAMLLFVGIAVVVNPWFLPPIEPSYWRWIHVGAALLFFIASVVLKPPILSNASESHETHTG